MKEFNIKILDKRLIIIYILMPIILLYMLTSILTFSTFETSNIKLITTQVPYLILAYYYNKRQIDLNYNHIFLIIALITSISMSYALSYSVVPFLIILLTASMPVFLKFENEKSFELLGTRCFIQYFMVDTMISILYVHVK